MRMPNAFRVCRQGIHDSIVGGAYAAKVAKAKKLTKWMTCSPDYAYGRDTTRQFVEYLKHFNPDVEVVGEAWPKLFQPDYTENITKILQTKPQALYSCLWGGDLTSFVDQGNIYALFTQTEIFAVNMADYTTLTAVKNLPKGIHSGNRYIKTFPKTPQNAAWADAYRAKYNDYPTNWSWENATAINFLAAAAKKTNSTDGAKLADALRGMKIKSPFGTDGTRDDARRRSDHHRLRDRLGHDDPHRALRPRRHARRLEADLRARGRVEEEEGLHSDRRACDLMAWARGARSAAAPFGISSIIQLPGSSWISPRLLSCLSSPACVVTQATGGLIIGMLLFLVAAGLTLIFGMLKVINFTHGSFYMLGAYFALTHFQTDRQLHAGACSARRSASALVGADLRAPVHEPGLRPNVLMQLLVCYGFILILDDVVKIIWGAGVLSMGMPTAFQVPPIFVAGGVVPVFYLFLIGVTLVIGARARGCVIDRTRHRQDRARGGASIPTMTSALGINTG